ncbi:MAG: RHS repeat-associated core domain-containing protein [Sedimentibacter sp.]|uniref:RHS repeat-associated core domain-containing protein n=1 Tax=Sedimentibacter sp. TaxID=1960295 RepID=UPI0031599215
MFEYDSMNNLIKTSMHHIDTQDNVDEWEVTLYEFDGRGLVTKEVNALGSVTTYVYDGNGNLKTKTDADGKVTAYAYNGLDMITSINYNGGKEVSYRYNKVGDLVEMNDWTGKTSFEVDLLNRITRNTDTKGKVVEYNYDETGNQTSVKYPDNTTATKTYDLLGNLKSVTETDGRTTHYNYDGMNRISKMEYPHGWVEDYQYDSVGHLLNVTDTDPSNNDMKQQKHAYTYDDCGNMTYEYMRGNGTGEATGENTYTYDALHRVISAHENYGNKTRTYQYDSLGNLTYETELGNKSIDYKFNNLNQITKKTEDGWMSQSDFTYDRRGNLIQETYTKNSKISVTGEYTYDETNKMVLGVNELGESSAYLYNGLGALVENTWVIKKNAYGYHDVSALTNMVAGEVVVDPQTGKKDKKDKLAPEVVAASPELNKTSTVVKQFVVDYTSDTFEPLMEYEINSLEYRYVYSNDRLSVNITGVDTSAGNLIENVNQIRLYYHMDYLGTADYLTSPMTGKVESWTHYNEWGEITNNAVLKCGQRELDMVKRYATHDYDSVLSMYYAKARFYDAGDRRFTAIDPILDGSKYDITDYAKDPVQFVQYLYVKNNPVIYIDPDGLRPVIDDLDPYGAYSKRQEKKETEKLFDYRYYRQEHKDMFIEGIVSSVTVPVHGFDLSQARDYNKKIKKCDNNLISDERMRNADLDFYIQHSPMTEGMANGMYGGNFWSWFFDKAGLIPEGYEAIPYSGDNADLYKKGELLGNSIPAIYGFSEFVVAYLQKTPDKVPYVEGAGKYSDEFTNWLNAGSANNKVYQGVINGEPVYTGITKQELSTRLYQHNYGGKGLDYLQETFSGLTRNQARAIEQYFIENGPGNVLNQINSISPTSTYYNDAMRWATGFINGLK